MHAEKYKTEDNKQTLQKQLWQFDSRPISSKITGLLLNKTKTSSSMKKNHLTKLISFASYRLALYTSKSCVHSHSRDENKMTTKHDTQTS